jgi:L-ascorbate metabolism protein UlaG (beta-lactamase superfamily)
MSDRLRWIGHATVELTLGGTVVLTDPVLRTRVGHLRRVAPEVAVTAGATDVVVLSHLHRDHTDLPSLRRLGGHPAVVVPRGAARFLPTTLRARAVELAVGEGVTVDGVGIRAVPARHDGRRHPLARAASGADALGYVVTRHGERIYFAGDTDLFDGMAHIGEPGLDVALLPVAGWGPRLGPGHLDAERAARAAALLRPAVVVPIHWGTLVPAHVVRRREALLTEPLPAFRAALARRAPDVRLAALAPGGTLPLPAS